MISKTVLSLFAILLLVGCQADDQVTIDSLIARHTDSRGGENAIENVQSLRLGLEITEPGFTVRGDYLATRDGYVRIDIYAGDERVFTEALGPDGGWQLLQGETVFSELSQDGERALRRGLAGNLYGLHELSDLGYTLTLAGTVTRGAQDYWAIDQVAPDGFYKQRLMDKSSLLIVREIENTALHPDVDPTKTQQETLFMDYEASAGVLFSRFTKKIDSTTGAIIQTVALKEVEVNPAIDATRFKRPNETTVLD